MKQTTVNVLESTFADAIESEAMRVIMAPTTFDAVRMRQYTIIDCDTGFWVIDTQEAAEITWHPENDTFDYQDATYTRVEMTAILESSEKRAELDAADPYDFSS